MSVFADVYSHLSSKYVAYWRTRFASPIDRRGMGRLKKTANGGIQGLAVCGSNQRALTIRVSTLPSKR